MDTESDTPQGITSSADRMVGMEHSEVRYFTRYVFLHRLGLLDVDTNKFIAMTTTVNYLDQRWRIFSVVLTNDHFFGLSQVSTRRCL